MFGAPNEKQNGESGRAIVEDWFELFVKNFDLDRGVMIDYASTPQKRRRNAKSGRLNSGNWRITLVISIIG